MANDEEQNAGRSDIEGLLKRYGERKRENIMPPLSEDEVGVIKESTKKALAEHKGPLPQFRSIVEMVFPNADPNTWGIIPIKGVDLSPLGVEPEVEDSYGQSADGKVRAFVMFDESLGYPEVGFVTTDSDIAKLKILYARVSAAKNENSHGFSESGEGKWYSSGPLDATKGGFPLGESFLVFTVVQPANTVEPTVTQPTTTQD